VDIPNQRLYLPAYSLILPFSDFIRHFSRVGAVALAEEATPSLYKRNRGP
jgi:hypothetical protein